MGFVFVITWGIGAEKPAEIPQNRGSRRPASPKDGSQICGEAEANAGNKNKPAEAKKRNFFIAFKLIEGEKKVKNTNNQKTPK